MLMPIIPNTNSVLTSCSFYILLPNSNFSAHWTLRYTWQLQDGPIANSFKWKHLIPRTLWGFCKTWKSSLSSVLYLIPFLPYSGEFENQETDRQTERETHTQAKAEREQSGKMWFYFKLCHCKNWEIKIVGNSPRFLNKVLIHNIAFWDPHSAGIWRARSLAYLP